MGIRLSVLVAFAAAALPIVRLTRLIRTEESTTWLFLLAGAFLAGMLITWAVTALRRSVWLAAGVNVSVAAAIVIAYLAPGTLRGVLPTADTWTVVGEELGFALELLRFGTAPVLPVAGLVAVLGALFWVFGLIAALAVDGGRPLVAVAAPSALYLQLATIDRTPSGPVWIAAFLSMIGAALLVSEVEERRRSTGRLRSPAGTMLKRTALGRSAVYLSALVIGATVVGLTVSTMVPATGLLNWRARSGIGTGIYGGVSYNLFVSTVQTDLVSTSDEPVFVARTSDPATANRTYWRLITLEEYDGKNWFPGVLGAGDPDSMGRWERGDHAYQGATRTVDQRVQIRSLRQNYIPAMYSPIDLTSDNRILADSFRVREDGAIKFDALTSDGLTYTVRSVVPDDPLTELATVDGEFTPMFVAAAEDGQFAGSPGRPHRPLPRPQNIAVYLELPLDLDQRIIDKADELTRNGAGDFEKALLLEAFYRSPREFLYSVDIDPGHSASDLASWLFDPESPNFRTGYCEQFATGMAVMARAIGIPSRVAIGFTPGEVGADGVITVRQKNAHAWVELWIDDHGWVQFDPTPRGDGVNPATSSALAFDPTQYAVPVEAPEAEEPAAESQSGTPDIPDLAIPELLAQREAQLQAEAAAAAASSASPFGGLSLPDWWWRVPASSLLLVFVPLIKWARRRWRLRKLLRGDVEAAWNEITDQLRDSGLWDGSSADTPRQVAEHLEPIRPLADRYAEQLWSSRPRSTATVVRESIDALEAGERALRRSQPWWRRTAKWWNPRSVVRVGRRRS